MNTLGIIPARYGSTRFEGKPLALIHGKPMIQCVYEQVMHSNLLQRVVVATDDDRIARCVESFGGNVCMTGSHHKSGTERCGEVLAKQIQACSKEIPDVIVNIQGDEPQIQPEQIQSLLQCFDNENTDIATLVKEITNEEELLSPNVVKCVRNHKGEALYFSRWSIPFERNPQNKVSHYKHLGIYAYRTDVLQKLIHLPPCDLETAESLEQLRWLYHGFSIHTRETAFESIGIDTPEDLKRINL